eukprot:TRINITY_DN25_c0_g1_i2.p1 TRINITY_DN25_c0_g1~~TRINITY_DN25_c0_g1_i2.p1  ORF type:complete len:961 (+),score=159.85 TRINITY_DN25_c0_g1_i2:2186-5068(+)
MMNKVLLQPLPPIALMRLLTTLNDPSRQLSIENILNTLVAAARREGATEDEVRAVAEAAITSGAPTEWHDLGQPGSPVLTRHPAGVEEVFANLKLSNITLRITERFHQGPIPWPCDEDAHFRSIEEHSLEHIIPMDQVFGSCAATCVSKGVGKFLSASNACDLLPPLALHIIAAEKDNIVAALEEVCYFHDVVEVVHKLLPGVVKITRVEELSVPRDDDMHERIDCGFSEIPDLHQATAFLKAALAPSLSSERLPCVVMAEVRAFTSSDLYEKLKAPGAAGGPTGWTRAWFPSDPESRDRLRYTIVTRRSKVPQHKYGGHAVGLSGIFRTNNDSWVIVEDHHGSDEEKHIYAMSLDDVLLRCTDFWIVTKGGGKAWKGEKKLRDLDLSLPEVPPRGGAPEQVHHTQESTSSGEPSGVSASEHSWNPKRDGSSRKRRREDVGEMSRRRRRHEIGGQVDAQRVEPAEQREVCGGVEDRGVPVMGAKRMKLDASMSKGTLAVWNAETFCLPQEQPGLHFGVTRADARLKRMKDILAHLGMEHRDVTAAGCKVEQHKEHHTYYIGAILNRLEKDLMSGVGLEEVKDIIGERDSKAALAAGVEAKKWVEAHGLMQALEKHTDKLQAWFSYFSTIDANLLKNQRRAYDYYRCASSFPALRFIAQPLLQSQEDCLAIGSTGLSLRDKGESLHFIMNQVRLNGISTYPSIVCALEQWRKALRRNPPSLQFPRNKPRFCCGVIERVNDLDGVIVKTSHWCVAKDGWGEVEEESNDESEDCDSENGVDTCKTCRKRHGGVQIGEENVRIAGIDGIESTQHAGFYNAALRAASTAFPKDTPVALEVLGDDQFGRVVAKVCALTPGDKRTDMGRWLVRHGIAYVSTNFCQGDKYDKAEIRAKKRAHGLKGVPEGSEANILDWAVSNGIYNIHIAPQYEKPWLYKSRMRIQKMSDMKKVMEEPEGREKGKNAM